MTCPAVRQLKAKKAPAGKRFRDGPEFQLKPPLALELPAFAGGHDGGGIDGFSVFLHLHHFAFLIDQESDAACSMILVVVDTDLFGQVAAPVAEDGEFESFFFRPRGVAERAVHANTQDLGVRGFQFLQVLLESLEFGRSTTGKGEDDKCKSYILLASEVFQGNFIAVLVNQCEIRECVAYLDIGFRRRRWSFFLLALSLHSAYPQQSQEHDRQQEDSGSLTHWFFPPLVMPLQSLNP